MKLKDITISTRLALGFGTCVALVLVLAFISFNQANRLWRSTNELYSHPYQVGRSVRDIQIGVLQIHRKMKDIAMDELLTKEQILTDIHFIDSVEISIYGYFDKVRELYLGPVTDVDKSYQSFREWKNVRDNLIETRQTLGRDEAFKQYTEVNKQFANTIIPEISLMIKFSSEKGDSFYEQAGIDNDKLLVRLVVITIIIIVFSILLTFLLIKVIKGPLVKLKEITEVFSNGNYSVRSDYVSKNEIGILASSFNNMASKVQNDIILKENAAWVSHLMMNENELRPFCKGLMNALINKTESQIAAFFILNKNTGKFEHFESIGLATERIRDFSTLTSEGEFGITLTDKNIVRITLIPDDTMFSFSAVTGNFKPREILTIPVVEYNEVIAVISLASLKNYSELSVRLLHDIRVLITARFLGVMNFQKIKDFSAVLDMQNKELDQKSKELVMQSDELKEYNIELELQKKQLDESNKLKSAFLSNMSHELRTPLNSVIALSGVLNRRLNGKIPEDEFSYLGIIEKNGKNLLNLINDILDLSRIEAGKEEISYSQFSMSELIEEIINSLEPIFKEKGISVSLDRSVDLPEIISDNKKCRHIMQNIISNAVKFTEKGSVEISTSVVDDNIRISVKDTGIGISDEFLPFVFDEFRQADDNASRKFGGTGLGMSIVKKYCQLLNGNASVTSIHGKGSEVVVVLPLGPSDAQIPDNSHQESDFDSDSKSVAGKTILLVEDNESQIIQLNDILKDEGYNILVARNGREALSIISSTVPDSMILDLQMPEVDGFEVLREIRNLEETKRIPVLILTAKHITKAELSFLKENNVYQLIQKGNVNRNDLLGHIRNLTTSHRKTNPSAFKKAQTGIVSTDKPHILLLEDNMDNVITLKALLEDRYLISTAYDGIEGLQMAHLLKPDLMLLDISLPLKDGLKVLSEIKSDEKLKTIPVIALTARAMKGDREELLAQGFDGYIAKPVDNETFEKTINGFLGNRGTTVKKFPGGQF